MPPAPKITQKFRARRMHIDVQTLNDVDATPWVPTEQAAIDAGQAKVDAGTWQWFKIDAWWSY